MRPILVGEDNPYSRDPRYALYGEPEGSAGWRLCHVILGLGLKEYVRDYARVNLCSRQWAMREAKQTAENLISRNRGSTFVLLGKKVATAFGVDFEPFTVAVRADMTFVILPHPSGRNRLWNDRSNIDKARVLLREAGALRTEVAA